MINLLYWSIFICAVTLIIGHLMKKYTMFNNKRIYIAVHIVIVILCIVPIMSDFAKKDFPVSYSEEYVIDNSIIDVNELENVGEIVEGNNVEQYFVCNKNSISYISLYMYTYERNNLGNIHVELVDETDNQVVDEWDVDTIDIQGNEYLKLEVENPFAFKLYGHDCYIRISSDTVNKYSAVTIKKQSLEYDTTKLVVGGVEQEGNLIFNVVGYGQPTSKEWTRVALCLLLLSLVELSICTICGRKHD